MLLQRFTRPRRPVEQFAATIRAPIIQRFGTFGAICALERADESPACISGKVEPATFAIGTHLQHQAATRATSAQIRSTTSRT